MATRPTDTELREPCAECGRETAHAVTIELRTESTTGENAAFSREPYRVRECRVCGRTSSLRMNDV